MPRRKIDPEDRVKVKLSVRDRDLLDEYAMGDPEYVERLQSVTGKPWLVGHYTLNDLEDILGYIAATSNDTDDRKLKKELQNLYDRLAAIQDRYDDGGWAESAV